MSSIILGKILEDTPTFSLDKLEEILNKSNENFIHKNRRGIDNNKRIFLEAGFNKNNQNNEVVCRVGYVVFKGEGYSPVLLGLSGKHLSSKGGETLKTYKIDNKGRCSIPCCFYEELKEEGFPSYDLFIGESLFVYSPNGLIRPRLNIEDYFNFS